MFYSLLHSVLFYLVNISFPLIFLYIIFFCDVSPSGSDGIVPHCTQHSTVLLRVYVYYQEPGKTLLTIVLEFPNVGFDFPHLAAKHDPANSN